MIILQLLIPLVVCALGANAKHLTIPLARHQREHSVGPHLIPAIARRAPDESQYTTARDTHSGAFWHGSFEVGSSKNLTLQIDTGTSVVLISPGDYKPGKQSVSLNQTHPNNAFLNETHWTSFEQTEKNGCGILADRYDVYEDTISFAGVTAKHQKMAVSQYVKLVNDVDRMTRLTAPYQGLVGFITDSSTSVITRKDIPFMLNLYNQGEIEELRFGLAFGTSGRGKQILGGLDGNLFEGSLVEVPFDYEWSLTAALTANGSVVADNQLLLFDSGGPQITGNSSIVRTLFEKSGIQAVDTDTVCGRQVYGYYACDAAPSVGFEIGGTNFAVDPVALKWKDDGANNCTAIISGHDNVSGSYWVVGNAWMEGKYIDHHSSNKSMGFAILKDPVSATS